MSQVMIITGSRKGIGFELAKYYLEKGHIVVGCSRRESNFNHKNYRHWLLDVSNEGDVVKMVRETHKEFQRIDVLINNAGIATMNPLLLTPLTSVNKILETNFNGTFLFTREVAKIMIQQKKGNIINFTSVAVPLNLEGESIYAASKAAIESFTKTSAKELAPYGIRINAIGPTPVKTDLVKNVPGNKLENLIQKQAIKRYGEISDIMNVTEFFLDEKSNFITGQVIYLGGI